MAEKFVAAVSRLISHINRKAARVAVNSPVGRFNVRSNGGASADFKLIVNHARERSAALCGERSSGIFPFGCRLRFNKRWLQRIPDSGVKLSVFVIFKVKGCFGFNLEIRKYYGGIACRNSRFTCFKRFVIHGEDDCAVNKRPYMFTLKACLKRYFLAGAHGIFFGNKPFGISAYAVKRRFSRFKALLRIKPQLIAAVLSASERHRPVAAVRNGFGFDFDRHSAVREAFVRHSD